MPSAPGKTIQASRYIRLYGLVLGSSVGFFQTRFRHGLTCNADPKLRRREFTSRFL
jgi:hypothetical protein